MSLTTSKTPPTLLSPLPSLDMEPVTVNATLFATNQTAVDNTTTFLVGFGILLLFVVAGILASAFLCITLKKDPYLWEADRERQLQEKEAREREEEAVDCTQI